MILYKDKECTIPIVCYTKIRTGEHVLCNSECDNICIISKRMREYGCILDYDCGGMYAKEQQ